MGVIVTKHCQTHSTKKLFVNFMFKRNVKHNFCLHFISIKKADGGGPPKF